MHSDAMGWLKPRLSRIAKQDTKSSLAGEWKAHVADLVKALAPRIAPAFNKLATSVVKANAAAIRSMGIDVRGELGAQIEYFRDWNMRLITNAGRNYADDVAEVLDDPNVWGLRVEEIAAKISERADVAESHAELIARDQASKMNGTINQFRQTHAGVDSYEWSGSLDERERDTHLANEGKVFSWQNPPSETGHPTEDVQCRCVAIPVIPELDES